MSECKDVGVHEAKVEYMIRYNCGNESKERKDGANVPLTESVNVCENDMILNGDGRKDGGKCPSE